MYVYRIYDIVEKDDILALWILHVIFSPLAGMPLNGYKMCCSFCTDRCTGSHSDVWYGAQQFQTIQLVQH